MDEECWDPGRTPAPAPRERSFPTEARVACPLCSLSWPLIALGGLDPKLCEASEMLHQGARVGFEMVPPLRYSGSVKQLWAEFSNEKDEVTYQDCQILPDTARA